jgi:predicted alpha/beta-fold hydrolase
MTYPTLLSTSGSRGLRQGSPSSDAPESSAGFRPPRWARGPNTQTLLGRALRPRGVTDLRRERWTTPDGDFLDVDFTRDADPSSPLILVLHGLEGSSRRGYVLSTLEAIQRSGLGGVALNFRGCSGQSNVRPRAYHSGETSDPTFVLDRLRLRFPGRQFGAVGFSLGGNVLLKLLGEGGRASRWLDAAVAISVPYDLAAGAHRLEDTRWGRLYARHFLRSLKSKIRDRAHILREKIDLDRTLESVTLREFDDACTAPLHGFRDAAHYYQESSSAAYLASIRTSTLLIHAMDDPFLPAGSVPLKHIDGNPHLAKQFSAFGGHVGFVHGAPWTPRFWAEERAAAFLAETLTRSPRSPSVERNDSEGFRRIGGGSAAADSP